MPVEPERKATVRIDVPKEKRKLFAPYRGMGVGSTAEIEVSGKVVSIREDEYGCSLEIELTGKEEKGTVKEAIREMRQSKTVGYR